MRESQLCAMPLGHHHIQSPYFSLWDKRIAAIFSDIHNMRWADSLILQTWKTAPNAYKIWMRCSAHEIINIRKKLYAKPIRLM